MATRTIVVVGGVAGGASAAVRARRLDEHARIVLLEKGPHVSFANCGLPYFLGGEIEDRDELLVATPEGLAERFGIEVRVGHEVTRIDRAGRAVEGVRGGGEAFREVYDALVLAVGAAPVRPPIPGLARAGHFPLRNLVDLDALDGWIGQGGCRRAVVVGGGFVGLECAEQLVHRGLAVSLVEGGPQVLAPLDAEMAARLHHELVGKGVALHLGDPVAAFEEGPGARASVVRLRSGAALPADLVVLALGVKPASRLAVEAGLAVGELGGVRVDPGLRTSDPAIFAVGDVIEVRCPVTGVWRLLPLAGPANRQGRIAAENACGGSAVYRGTLGTAITRVFGLTAAATGLSERALGAAGVECRAVHIHPGSHASYYPGARPVHLKLVFAPGTGKLFGAQAVGEDGVDKRIDVLATALAAGMTVHDLTELELAYAPPFSSAKDPVNLAGMVAEHLLDGSLGLAQWHEVAGLAAAGAVLVDVRSAEEREAGTIPGSRHVPLEALRGRLGELPRESELVVFCRSGQRSYYAQRILSQHGFKVRSLSGGMLTWEPATRPIQGAGAAAR